MSRSDNGTTVNNRDVARVYGLKLGPRNVSPNRQRVSFSHVATFDIPVCTTPSEQLATQQDIANSCREKHWFRHNQPYLVLVRGMSFTINF